MKKLVITLMIIVSFVACTSNSDDSTDGDNVEVIEQTRYGVDHILLAGKKPEFVIQHHPKGWHFGTLYKVDGNPSALPAIVGIAKRGDVPSIKAHLVWKDDHKFGKSEADLAVRRCRELEPTVRKYQKVQWYISPWLEPIEYSSWQYNNVINKCRSIFNGTNVRMVSTAIPPEEFAGAYTEMHHKDYKPTPKLKLFSYDGLEMTAQNWREYKAKITEGTEVIYTWAWCLNGKKSKSDKTLRPDRSAWCTAEDIKRLVELVR